jgi:hypothetical protein
MREFSFSPAALRKMQVWTIKDGHLLRRGGDRAVKLADLSAVAWGSFAYRGTQSQWLHLTGAQGVTKVECNAVGGSDQDTFEALVSAIAQEAAAVNPNLRVHTSGGGGYMWAMFVIGGLGAICGLVFLISGLLGLVRQGEVLAILLGGGLAAVFGAMAWHFAPWRAKTFVSIMDFAAKLAAQRPALNRPQDDASDQ